MLEVRVDRGKCQGAGECVYLAPKSFSIDVSIRAVPADPPEDSEQVLVDAAACCPNMAITVVKDGVVVAG